MKFFASLPNQKHYLELPQRREGTWLFEDKATNLVMIESPHPSPWDKAWVIIPSIQRVKNSPDSQYPGKIRFRLYTSSEDAIPAIMHRERYKGNFAYTSEEPIAFFAFLTEPPRLWLIYRFNSLSSKDL